MENYGDNNMGNCVFYCVSFSEKGDFVGKIVLKF